MTVYARLPNGKRVRVVRRLGRLGAELRFVFSCTGCYDSDGGHPTGHYLMHPQHRVWIGAGCGECGYWGIRRVRWWAPMRVIGVSLAERRRVNRAFRGDR
jgi:hypothetical protein